MQHGDSLFWSLLCVMWNEISFLMTTLTQGTAISQNMFDITKHDIKLYLRHHTPLLLGGSLETILDESID